MINEKLFEFYKSYQIIHEMVKGVITYKLLPPALQVKIYKDPVIANHQKLPEQGRLATQQLG